MTTPYTIAIDGLAATGKGTIARRLAEGLDFAHLDTGLLYRAVGLVLLREGTNPSDESAATLAAQALDPSELMAMADDPALRTAETGQAASKCSVIPAVRDALLKFQTDFCANPPEGKLGAVLDGRDIGTVIAPDAIVKIYVEASPEVRAHRRFLELQKRGENVTEAAVLADLRERDERDVNRATVPTKPADDAIHLDTTELTADEAFEKAVAIVKEKLHA